jgi:hypothetical protein
LLIVPNETHPKLFLFFILKKIIKNDLFTFKFGAVCSACCAECRKCLGEQYPFYVDHSSCIVMHDRIAAIVWLWWWHWPMKILNRRPDSLIFMFVPIWTVLPLWNYSAGYEILCIHRGTEENLVEWNGQGQCSPLVKKP